MNEPAKKIMAEMIRFGIMTDGKPTMEDFENHTATIQAMIDAEIQAKTEQGHYSTVIADAEALARQTLLLDIKAHVAKMYGAASPSTPIYNFGWKAALSSLISYLDTLD